MTAYLETEAIEAARAAAEGADARWFTAKEALEAAGAASDAAKAEAAEAARKVAPAEKALASGAKSVREAWQRARWDHEMADARARACHQAVVDATAALNLAERVQRGAWNAHAELVRLAHVDEVTRILGERDRLLLQAAEKWTEAEALFSAHVHVARMRLPYQPLTAADSLAAFDAAGRAFAFRAPPAPRGVPCTDEARQEYRARIGADVGWGTLSEDEIVKLASVVLKHGGRDVAGLLGLWRYNTSPAHWYDLAHIPLAIRPKFLGQNGKTEPTGEDIAEVQRALRGSFGDFDEDKTRKVLGLPASAAHHAGGLTVMWQNLVGVVKHYAGTAGTVTIGAGESILIVQAHASAGSATLSILGGAAIPVVNGAPPMSIQMFHTLLQANAASSSVVFANTDSYYIQTIKQGHAG